jgi:hypothetical protein
MKPILLGLLLLLPSAAGAQTVSPTAPAFPGLRWALGAAIPTGQLLRTVWVPPQTVVIDTVVPVPADPGESKPGEADTTGAAAPPQYGVLRQTLVVPGYWVRQTTAGAYYPERWTLEQVAPGTYRWRLLPAEVRAY